MPPPLRSLLAFGSIMGCSSSLNNLFVTFYLELFLRLPPAVFFSGQLLYMAWNSLNDPICGWISDRLGHKNPRQLRLEAIKYGGVLWACAFCLVFFAPSPSTAPAWLLLLHFAFSTCAYDTMLTLVEVNHSALLAELTVDDAERATYNGYAAVFAGLGSLTSFVGHWLWDQDNHWRFQLGSLVLGLVSSLVFVASAETLMQQPSSSSSSSSSSHSTPPTKPTVATGAPASIVAWEPMVAFAKELTKQRNFWLFAMVATVQSFDCAFEKTSFALVLDQLDSLSKTTRALLVSSSFLLPWAGTLLVTPRIQTLGVYSVFRSVLAVRIAMCVLFYIARPSLSQGLISFFLLSNRVASETVCRISPLVLSDLVDEDRFLHRRDSAVTRAGSVIGASHFISKFGSSAGPMLGFQVFATPSTGLAALVLVPLACVLFQGWVWTVLFSLHGAYLERVKGFQTPKRLMV